jgi:hypothetical protein
VLNLDFEKAFDKVNWNFLINCLKAMAISDFLCQWIQKILTDCTVSVKIDNTTGLYFKSAKGVRQVIPYPLFFLMQLFNVLLRWFLRLSRMVS